ncbi:class I SAM-dependent methyltransferase [Lewinella sp. LCG006]|uniref:class I SAM-dependent methyltransferase n=1 Tax=Lewinella sp. LCG006 TaxID=3231911 RepID=UPI003460B3B2
MNHFLEERLRSDLVMYEYGSGYSTLYFAQRIAKVYTIEYDQEWFNWLAKELPKNVVATYKALEDNEYVNNIASINESFDIIIVDGRRRNECIKASLAKLKPNGVIILDDTHRKKYQSGYALIEEKGFKKLNFWGFSNGSIDQKCSTLFYRQDNCFDI